MGRSDPLQSGSSLPRGGGKSARLLLLSNCVCVCVGGGLGKSVKFENLKALFYRNSGN